MSPGVWRRLRRGVALGATLALGAVGIMGANAAEHVTVSRDLAQGAQTINRDTMVINFEDRTAADVQPVSGLKKNVHPWENQWSLADGADEGTMRVTKGAHMGSTWYDVLVTNHPDDRSKNQGGVFLQQKPTAGNPHTGLAIGARTTGGVDGQHAQYNHITLRIVKAGTNDPAPSFSDGVMVFSDLDGWLNDNPGKPDAKKHDEGVRLTSGFTSAAIAPDAHIDVTDNGSTFTGMTDEDDYLGDAGPVDEHHNLQHMLMVHFNSPTLEWDYFAHRGPRWSMPMIRTNPPLFPSMVPVSDRHTATRTITMHEPVNKTVKQPVTVSHTGQMDPYTGGIAWEDWNTGSWAEYAPEVPEGYHISSGPSHVDSKTVTHTTGDETVNIYYEPTMTDATQSRTVTRTITMHEPVNRTVTQKATLARSGRKNMATGETTWGEWTTGTWDEYRPETQSGWSPDKASIGERTVTHGMNDATVDVWYSTTPRFMTRTPSCGGNGSIKYTGWSQAPGGHAVRYGEAPVLPDNPSSLPSSWGDKAWWDAPENGSKLDAGTRVTSANPTYWWRGDAPSASYTVTTKSRLDGRTLESHRVSGAACAITTPNPVIPDGWVPDGDPDAPDVAIPVDGRTPSDVTVWVRRPGVSQLPQTGGWRLTMMVGVPVLLTLLLGGVALTARMRAHAGREH